MLTCQSSGGGVESSAGMGVTPWMTSPASIKLCVIDVIGGRLPLHNRKGEGRERKGGERGGVIPTLPPALENTQWNWPRYSIPSNAVRKNVSGLIVDYLGRRVQIVSAGISILVCR